MARNHDMSGIMDWWKRKSQPKPPPGPPPPIHVDLYDVLRVSPTASQDEIKAAFRSLALMFHPDRNPGDPTAEKKYAQISSAYSILGDETQRAAYDRLRAPEAPPPPPPPRQGIIPRPEELERETPGGLPVQKPATPPAPSKPQPTMWEMMFGKPEEEEAPTGSIFEVFAKESPPPPQIPSAQSPYGWATPFQKKVPLTPQIDTPSQQEIFQILQQWPLDGIWDLVRHDRHTQAFYKAKALAVDALGGAGPDPAEWDMAEMFGIPKRQVDEFVHHRGRDAFFREILYPIFDQVTQIMGQIKPVDLPGQFFLDWDQTGRVIELIYAENVGRRPWE